MKGKAKNILSGAIVTLFLFSLCQLHAGSIRVENAALGKNYDFNRLPEAVEENIDKILTDGVKATEAGKGSLCWKGSEEVIITLDLARLYNVRNAKVDFSKARTIKVYISKDNVQYEELPVGILGHEVIIGGTEAVKGQFLKIAVIPEGNLKCSEIEVNGYTIGEGVRSDIGLNLYLVAKQKIGSDSESLPEGVSWDISKSYRDETPTRKKICLNGIWKFQPVEGESKYPPLSGWGYSQFPFVFLDKIPHQAVGISIYDKNMKVLKDWNGVLVKDIKNGWWKREFRVPVEFRDRRVYIKIDYIGYYGKVYLNGKLVGEGYINRENRFDISGMINWDQPNELALFASGDPKSQRVFSRGNAVNTSIVGDVWLESFPKQAYLKTTQIVTSTRKQELKLLTDITGRGEFTLSGKIYDKDGKVKDLPAKKIKADGNRVEYIYPWKDAKRWSVENPYLYWLVLYLKDERGNVIDQAYRERFGFREFWSEGGDYYLNGIKTHLFRTSPSTGFISHLSNEEWIAKTFGMMKKMGFNSVGWPVATYDEKILKVADEIGLLAIPDAAEIVMTGGFETDATKGLDLWLQWNSSEKAQQQARDDMKELIARLGNHPSLVMWIMTFNSLDHPWTMNPYKIDGSYIPYQPEGKGATTPVGFLTKEKVDVALKLESLLYEFDASRRPIFHHSCGNVGQAITVNGYFNFGFPKQEWEDWPMFWSKKKPKPLINTEDCRPVFPAWYGVSDHWNWMKYESLHIEYAAMYLGDDSYRLFTPQAAEVWSRRKSMSENDLYYTYVWNTAPQCLEIGCLLTRDIERAWRTYGVSGIGLFAIEGISHDEFDPSSSPISYPDPTAPGPKGNRVLGWVNINKPNKLFYAIKDSFARVKVYIGGPGDNFTAKDHCYFSQEEVSKQVIILNDSERDVSGKAEVRLLGSGGINQTVLSKAISVKAGEQGREPLKFTAPAVKEREEFNAEVTLTTGKEEYKDVFRLTVFPREKASSTARVLLLDDVGITEKVLREAGVSFDKLEKAKNIDEYRILVIGREYGKKGGIQEATRIELQRMFERGISMVVFEQPKASDSPLKIDHNDTSFMGLKLREGSYRYAFIRDKSHPVLAGLESSDLIDWRGESDMMEAFPEPDPITETSYPERFWKLGNKGIVSTYAIEKPSKGSFRVIADAGFDLSDAVLLEWMEGKSRIIFCQADVSNRYGKDPVATKIIHNIFKYCEDSPRQTREAVYIGGERGIKLLDTVGVMYRKIDNAVGLTANNLLIIGDMTESQIAECGEKVRNFIVSGGIALYLPVATGQGYTTAVCPPGFTFEQKKFYMPESELMKMDFLRGLGIGDFFLKDYYEVVVPAGLPEGSAATKPAVVSSVLYGKGKCIFLSLDPTNFEKKYPYEKVIRDWNTILANLGVDGKDGMLIKLRLFLQGGTSISIELAGKWKFKIDPANKGVEEGWYRSEYNDSDWKVLQVPGRWEDQGIKDVNPYWKPVHENCSDCSPQYYYNGYAWYRKHVFIPESIRGERVSLRMGIIDDYDWTYVNGVQVGQMGEETPNAWCTQREYDIPAAAIRYGQDNIIIVRVYDLHGAGGIVGGLIKLTSKSGFYVEKYLTRNPYQYYRW